MEDTLYLSFLLKLKLSNILFGCGACILISVIISENVKTRTHVASEIAPFLKKKGKSQKTCGHAGRRTGVSYNSSFNFRHFWFDFCIGRVTEVLIPYCYKAH